MNDNVVDQTTNKPEQVFDRKYGYIEPEKLEKKLLSRRVTALNFAAVTMFVSMFFVSFVYGILLMILGYSGYTEEFYYAINWMATVLPTGLVFFVTARLMKMPMNFAVRVNRVNFSDALLMVLAGCGICLLSNFPAQWLEMLLEGMGINAGQSDTYIPSSVLGIVLYFITTAVLPPLFEEFAFRGVILGSLRKYGDFFALMVSSIIFGLMHMSLTTLPFAFIAGLAMGYVYIVTGNIWVNVGIHLLNNMVSVILSLTATYASESAAIICDLLIFYGLIFIGIISLIILLVRKRLPFRLYKPQMRIGGGDKFQCAVINPGFLSLLFIFTVYVTLTVLGVF